MEPEVSIMAEFLASCGEVLTACLGWATEVGETVVTTPLMLAPFAIAIGCKGISVFKSLGR